MANDLNIQAIAAQIRQGIPEGDRAFFGTLVDTVAQTFDELTPSHSQDSRESWVAASTWVLSVVTTGLKEQQPLTAQEMALIVKFNLMAMVCAIAADEAKATEVMRERLQAAVDASNSFWEE
jgi:hypothetical protein